MLVSGCPGLADECRQLTLQPDQLLQGLYVPGAGPAHQCAHHSERG